MTLHDSLTSTYAAMRRKGAARGTAAPRARAPETLHEHMHTDAESAYAAVRRSIAAGEERSAKERVAHDQQLLMERDVEALEAPPRTGPRKGTSRREYDRVRQHWRQELLHNVDEDVDPVRRSLVEAYGALVTGDRDGFVDAMNAALAERAREAMARQKFRMIADLLQSGATEEPEEGEG